MDIALLWIPATVAAAAAQVGRNALQRQLTAEIGTVAATAVRFLYGLPFALAFLTAVRLVGGEPIPATGPGFGGFLALGALAQIAATALMLAAMRERSLTVVTALMKTEAVQIAVFGFVVLGDRLAPLAILAVVVATVGVVLMSALPRAAGDLGRLGLRPVLLGIVAGGLFALSAVGYRGAILSLDGGSFLIRATTALVWGLALQTVLLLAAFTLFDRIALRATFQAWRTSLVAGLFGATASQFWFIGFALTAAANVRTLALVEVLMAGAVSRRLLAEGTSARETAGLVFVVAGVALLLAAHA